MIAPARYLQRRTESIQITGDHLYRVAATLVLRIPEIESDERSKVERHCVISIGLFPKIRIPKMSLNGPTGPLPLLGRNDRGDVLSRIFVSSLIKQSELTVEQRLALGHFIRSFRRFCYEVALADEITAGEMVREFRIKILLYIWNLTHPQLPTPVENMVDTESIVEESLKKKTEAKALFALYRSDRRHLGLDGLAITTHVLASINAVPGLYYPLEISYDEYFSFETITYGQLSLPHRLLHLTYRTCILNLALYPCRE